MKLYNNLHLLFSLAVLAIVIISCKPESRGALRVSEINPRYFTDNSGKAIYLTGSHTWNNLLDMIAENQPDTFDYKAYLEFLKSHNHNFFRLWKWDLLNWDTSGNREEKRQILQVHLQPWLRTGSGNALDGKPKFDLLKFNPEYFVRLRERVAAAAKEGIYVSVMLFEGWGLQFSPNAFINHPFHPLNNVNQIDTDTVKDPKGFAIYELVNEKITRLQEAYVAKVIETVGDMDNVLYEISNENHPLSTKWQYHMIRYIKKLEQEKGKQHPVGMTFQYKGGSNQTLFDSPADWISPNNEGGYKDNPPENTGSKVIIPDTDHLGGIWGNRKWVWKSFLRGLNPIFMDPYDGNLLKKGAGSDWAKEVRRAMGDTRKFAERMDLINTVPVGSMSSSGYCLANKGKEYLVYLPEGREADVNLSLVTGTFDVGWFDPVSGDTRVSDPVEGGQQVTLISPFNSDEAVIYLKLQK